MNTPLEITIDEFIEVMRKRDLYAEFKVWYAKVHAHEPYGFPMKLSYEEWLEEFRTTIQRKEK